MTNQEFLTKLGKCWEIAQKQYPNLRFGEMLASAGNYAMIYYATSENMLNLVMAYYGIKPEDIEDKVESVQAKVEKAQEEVEKLLEDVAAAEEAESTTETLEVSEEAPATEEAAVEPVAVEETVSYVYVNKDGVAKRILSTELEEYLANGYKKGRK